MRYIRYIIIQVDYIISIFYIIIFLFFSSRLYNFYFLYNYISVFFDYINSIFLYNCISSFFHAVSPPRIFLQLNFFAKQIPASPEQNKQTQILWNRFVKIWNYNIERSLANNLIFWHKKRFLTIFWVFEIGNMEFWSNFRIFNQNFVEFCQAYFLKKYFSR